MNPLYRMYEGIKSFFEEKGSPLKRGHGLMIIQQKKENREKEKETTYTVDPELENQKKQLEIERKNKERRQRKYQYQYMSILAPYFQKIIKENNPGQMTISQNPVTRKGTPVKSKSPIKDVILNSGTNSIVDYNLLASAGRVETEAEMKKKSGISSFFKQIKKHDKRTK